jgi:hypothetical protein
VFYPQNFYAAFVNAVDDRLKASVRAKVEHPFHVLKNLFDAKN